MVKNVKYKQICRIQLFGDDNINTTSNFEYSSGGSTVINSIRMRFNLNNSLAHIKLSQNARMIVETCNIPTITNLTSHYALLRLVSSTQDIVCDTKSFLLGNPIICSLFVGTTGVTLYNASEFFYNINIPQNTLAQGYIDMQLECPSQKTTAIDYLTSSPLSTFYINLIIIDEEPEPVNDSTLTPPIDYSNNNYKINFPIRQY